MTVHSLTHRFWIRHCSMPFINSTIVYGHHCRLPWVFQCIRSRCWWPWVTFCCEQSCSLQQLTSYRHCHSNCCHFCPIYPCYFWACCRVSCLEWRSTLSFDKHIIDVTRSCYYHICAVCHIRPLLTLDVAKAMAVSILGCRLHYCNSVLYGMSQANIDKLQRVQNILVRVVVGAPWTSSSLNICRDYTGYLLVIVLPTNCVSPPGKHFIPLSLSTCLNSFLTIFHPDPCILPI